MGKRGLTLEQRFDAHVDRNGPVVREGLGPCWIWTASRNKGYGQITVGSTLDGTRRIVRAHRVAFLLAHGRWPEPMGLHLCDNPACVKVVDDSHGPAHIVEGTHIDNMRGCKERGRTARGEEHAARMRGDRNVAPFTPNVSRVVSVTAPACARSQLEASESARLSCPM